MTDYDASVNLTTVKSLTIQSELDADAFEKAVFGAISAGKSISDLGWGRVLVDWSVLMRTRYVMCDIYEDEDNKNDDPQALKTYRIDVKTGEKTSLAGDIVYCFLFLGGFWFLRSYFNTLNPLMLVLTGLIAALAIWSLLTFSRSGFGKREAEEVIGEITENVKKSPQIGRIVRS